MNSRMAADGRRADHVDSQLVAKIAGFDVEVVEDLDVVGKEPDRHDHDVA